MLLGLALVGMVGLGPAERLAGQSLPTRIFTEADGLPASQTRDLAQDHTGRLWVLTRDGLAVYDGSTTRSVPNVLGQPSWSLAQLTTDPDGHLWTVSGHLPPRVFHLDEVRGSHAWTTLPSPQEELLPAIRPRDLGVERLVTSLAVLDSPAGDRQVLVGTNLGGLLHWSTEAERWSWRPLASGQDEGRVHGIVADAQRAWLATEIGLCVLDAASSALGCPHARSARPGLEGLSREILALALEPDPGTSSAAGFPDRAPPDPGRLWLLTRDQLLSWRPGDAETAAPPVVEASGLGLRIGAAGPFIPGSPPGTVGFDARGDVYFGSTHQMHFLDRTTGLHRLLGTAHGLPAEGLNAFLRGREGGTWIGTHRGLTHIASRRFLRWTASDGLLENEVTALVALDPNHRILGHNGGLTRMRGDSFERIPFDLGPDEHYNDTRVMELFTSAAGDVYFTASSRGLGRLEDDNSVTWLDGPGRPQRVPSASVGPEGRLWVAGGGDGLFEYADGRYLPRSLGDAPYDFVRRIVPHGDTLYLATIRGLVWGRPDRGWTWAAVRDGEPEESNAFAVLVRGAGDAAPVLVGTQTGLYRLDRAGRRLVAAPLGDQRIDRPVYFLLEGDGVLWIGTDNGFYRWDGRRLRHSTARHGLAGRETNRDAAYLDEQGRLWVGTEGGLSRFDPRLELENAAPPRAEIQVVETGGGEVDPVTDLHLPHDENTLAFQVAGISLSTDEPLVCRYYLEGFEEGWEGPYDLLPRVRYTNLSPGRYRFHFQVGRTDGEWSEPVSSETIVVRRPFWREPWFQGLLLGLLVAAVISAIRLYSAKRHAALHDSLTGLANRAAFTHRLEAALERRSRRGEAGWAVLFLDLDRFKNVNDSLGHATGDRLLVLIARRIGEVVRPPHLAARLGGDELAILVEDVEHAGDAEAMAAALHEAFARPFHLGEGEIFTTVSIGIALGAARYRHPEAVLRDADTAMYRAKGEGGGATALFDPSMHAAAVARLRLESDFRRALERHELRLVYQPIVRLADTSRPAGSLPSGGVPPGALVGAEALLRWDHPERGVLGPPQFLGLVEEAGLITQVGDLVLDEACRQLASWRRDAPLPEGFTLSVNVSPSQLTRTGFVERVEATLERHGLSGEHLVLEVTESALVEHPEAVRRLLQRCNALGVDISLDDFGTGHSALSYLQRLPLQRLKLDRSFIAPLETNPASYQIVEAIVGLCDRLGLSVTAEGVETERQAALLRRLGCPFAQGFLWSRPLDADVFLDRLRIVRAG